MYLVKFIKVCICGETYIEETSREVEARWKEENTPSDK